MKHLELEIGKVYRLTICNRLMKMKIRDSRKSSKSWSRQIRSKVFWKWKISILRAGLNRLLRNGIKKVRISHLCC